MMKKALSLSSVIKRPLVWTFFNFFQTIRKLGEKWTNLTKNTALAQITTSLTQINTSLAQISTSLAQIKRALAQIKQISSTDQHISSTDLHISSTDRHISSTDCSPNLDFTNSFVLSAWKYFRSVTYFASCCNDKWLIYSRKWCF
jgi:hypothetical protein